MEREWSFLRNPFLYATRDSYIMAMKISTFHDSALANVSNDPFFKPIFNVYHPLHTTYHTEYDAWVSQEHVQLGETLSLEQLIALLMGSKINQWDIAIQNVYDKKTSQYKTLLPHHRVPFQNGSQEERIEAVNSLDTNLVGISALSGVKTDVDSFLKQLIAANTTQKSGKTSKTVHGGSLEKARVNICNSQYATLGLLINHFSTTPEDIAAYFDLATIRSSSQVHFTGHLKPGHIHTVCKHTFGLGDEITIKNESVVALHVYLAATKNAPAPVGVSSIAAHTKQTLKVASIGNILEDYLIISNPDANITAQWELTLD